MVPPDRLPAADARADHGGAAGNRPAAALAERAAALGFDSVWVGDSLTARPRHDPLTLLAAVAGRVPGLTIGTAVLLPMLRNPVILAHQVATLDQLAEGKLILGVGFAADRPNIRAEFAAAGVPFEHRIGRMLEGLRLCKALWSGQPVDWDGRWQTAQAVVAPTPPARAARRCGSAATCRPAWTAPASSSTAGSRSPPPPRTSPPAWPMCATSPREHGRDPAALSGAMYLTVCAGRRRGQGRRPAEPASWSGTTTSPPRSPAAVRPAMPGPRPAWPNGWTATPRPAPATWFCASPATTNAIWTRSGDNCCMHSTHPLPGSPVRRKCTPCPMLKPPSPPTRGPISTTASSAAAAAKQALLERFRARPAADDPAGSRRRPR